jgi:hypothetical protein
MHLRDLFFEPVNFLVCAAFVLLIGLVLTSLVLDNSGLPNPMAYMGGQFGLFLLDHLVTNK